MNNKLKQWWAAQSARIDALSLRERVFLFLSFVAVGLALCDVLWLSPAQVAHKLVVQRFTTQTGELNRLREELKLAGQPVDASQVVREELAADAAKLEAINQEIRAIAPLAEGGPELEQVLVQFLKRHEGLTLVGLSTLASTSSDAPAAPAATLPAAGAPAMAPALHKRGLELKVSGPYQQLTSYVKALESALPTLRWGPMVLKSEKQVSEITLQVFVVGAQL